MLDVAERARTIVVHQLVVDPDEVIDGASFIDDLGADSLDMVELTIKFEREFGSEIIAGPPGKIVAGHGRFRPRCVSACI
jgi:acyl carrier protein